jgi:hypothetical protein
MVSHRVRVVLCFVVAFIGLLTAPFVRAETENSAVVVTQAGTTESPVVISPLSPNIADELSPLGVAFTLQPVVTSTHTAQAPLTITIDYRDLPYQNFGAAFEERLQLSVGTECDVAIGQCLAWTPLPTEKTLDTKQLIVTIPTENRASDTLYIVNTGIKSLQGDYSYAPLLSVTDQQVDLNSGAFVTSYPFIVPPARAGAAPQHRVELQQRRCRWDATSEKQSGRPHRFGLDIAQRIHHPPPQNLLYPPTSICAMTETISLSRSTGLVVDSFPQEETFIACKMTPIGKWSEKQPSLPITMGNIGSSPCPTAPNIVLEERSFPKRGPTKSLFSMCLLMARPKRGNGISTV